MAAILAAVVAPAPNTGFEMQHAGAAVMLGRRAAAERSGASLYAVVQPPDLRWHVPSVDYDPRDSPALAAFVAHVDTVVTVHGYGREGLWTTLLIGGRNRSLASLLGRTLRTGLGDGFTVLDDLPSIPRPLPPPQRTPSGSFRRASPRTALGRRAR